MTETTKTPPLKLINRLMAIMPIFVIFLLALASPSFREIFKHGLPFYMMDAVPGERSGSDTKYGELLVELYGGQRHVLASAEGVSFALYDGLQRLVKEGSPEGATISLPQLATNVIENRYTLIVKCQDGSGLSVTPVHVAPASLTKVHAMILRQDEGYDLSGVEKELSPHLRPHMARVLAGDRRQKDRFMQIARQQPEAAAGLLNLATALDEFEWKGASLLSYFQAAELQNVRRDRFFAYVDRGLIGVMQDLSDNGQAQHIPMSWTFHPGATTSYKETRLSEANLQVTFYESRRATVNGRECVHAEVDIDYYRDPMAHLFCEVMPHWFNHGTADPRLVYQIRWTECANKGLSFNPPYAIRQTDEVRRLSGFSR